LHPGQAGHEDELWDSITTPSRLSSATSQRKELAEIEARLAALTDDQRDVFVAFWRGMPTSGLPRFGHRFRTVRIAAISSHEEDASRFNLRSRAMAIALDMLKLDN